MENLLKATASAAGFAIALATVYALTITIYRLFFHPLATYPGPLVNKISWIPVSIWILQGRRAKATRQLHDKYGPVVRLSPGELSFNSSKAWTDIYGHRVGRVDLPKHDMVVGSIHMPGKAMPIIQANGADHSRQKKALSHGFSKRAVYEQESIVQEYVDKFILSMHQSAQTEHKTIDMCKWFNFLTFDLIGDMSFGESFGCLEKGDLHFWVKIIFDAVKGGAFDQATNRVATQGTWIHRVMRGYVLGDLAKQKKDHLEYSTQKVMKRLQDTASERKDFIYYILKEQEKENISHEEIVLNAALFIVAGSETTASALAGLVNLLLKHPRCYEKLQHEVRSAFDSEDDIRLASMDRLPYLTACIEEGLRCFPPVPVGFPRVVQPEGDIIDGYPVAGGTAVSVSTWSAGHDSRNFSKPDEFIPERWVDSAYSGEAKLASRPFGIGNRACIGRDIAYVEMRLTMARLIWNFDMKNADSAPGWSIEEDMRDMKAFTTWDKPPLNVVLIDRKMPASKFWGSQ